MQRFAVIIPAGGSSSRFGGGRNKLLAPLAGETVLMRAIRAFGRDDVATTVIATAKGILPEGTSYRTCEGGPSRAHSVLNALRTLEAEIEWVAVHDAARPLVTQALINRTFEAAVKYGAAVPALPVALTVKEADGPLPAKVKRTVPRQTLWAMQTPQVMRRADLLSAFERCPLPLEQITDDAQLLELAGFDVWLVAGEDRNIKITTAQDMLVAETILKVRSMKNYGAG
jgi:2-C-methyl-D-erythritol 4-phosphate cytidylyltransferase